MVLNEFPCINHVLSSSRETAEIIIKVLSIILIKNK